MSGQNPYEPPKADSNPSAEIDEAVLLMNAGRGARLVNFIIDGVMVAVIGSIAIVVLAVALGEEAASEGVSNLVALAVMIAYYLVLESLFGWTIGKLATGTRVMRADGRKPSFLQILGRTAARFIPFEPISLLGDPNAGWHDKLSGTRVVLVRR